MEMENDNDESVINMKEATELRLGLPGTHDDDDHQMAAAYKMNNKRASPEAEEIITTTNINNIQNISSKAQIVGWPPVKSYRKSTNVMMRKTTTEGSDHQMYYVKVSMDGAAYLRKVDLKVYNGYSELFKALETMFKLTIAEYAPAYQDKDGDLMLVGDVPWQMFMQSCKRLRIMKGADARGLGASAASSAL